MVAGTTPVVKTGGINPHVHPTELPEANCRCRILLTEVLLPALAPVPS